MSTSGLIISDAARKGGPGAPLRQRGMTDRSVFIKRDVINVYPDTLGLGA